MSIVAEAVVGPAVSESGADQISGILQMAGALLNLNVAVQCVPSREALGPAEGGGYGFNFIAPDGTQVRFSGAASEDEALLQAILESSGEGSVFLADVGSRVPVIGCKSTPEEELVAFESAQHVIDMIENGELEGLISPPALMTIQANVASCTNEVEAKCGGTLGPIGC